MDEGGRRFDRTLSFVTIGLMLLASALLFTIAVRRQTLSVVILGTTSEQDKIWRNDYPAMLGTQFLAAVMVAVVMMIITVRLAVWWNNYGSIISARLMRRPAPI